MHKLLTTMLCLLSACLGGFAQADSLPVIVPVNEWWLKINPLSFTEIEGGIGFSGEYILVKNKIGLQLEIQPLLFSIYKNYDFDEPLGTLESATPLGIKLRPEIRYYLDGLRSKKYHRRIVYRADGTAMPVKQELRTYVAVDFLYKYTQTETLSNLTINNGGTSSGYTQRAIYTDVKQLTGFDVKLGAVATVSKSHRWLLEFFVGAGYRHKKFSYKGLPVGASAPIRNNSISFFGERGVPTDVSLHRDAASLPAGLKIVYRLH